VCQKEVRDGTGIFARGRKWHTVHYRCDVCKADLDEKTFKEVENKLYCPMDALKKFGEICERCNIKIKGSFIKALDRSWHDACFNCTKCSKKFDAHLQGIHHIGSAPYCEDCYGAVAGGTCAVCNEVIGLADLIETLGDKFHRYCYRCCVGPHEMEIGNFWKHEGKMYCLAHWEASGLVDQCYACHKMIESEYVKIGTKCFHTKCWTCRYCKKIIKEDEVAQIQGQFYCVECARSGKVADGGHSRGGVYIPGMDAMEILRIKRLVRGYGEYECEPGVIPPSESCTYPLAVLRLRPGKIPKEIDFRQREQYLEESVFKEVFGVDMATFNDYPLWRRLMLKKEVELF